jgi:type II secretory pathway component PulF
MMAEIADYYRLLAEFKSRAFRGLLYPVALLQLAVTFQEIPRLFGDESMSLVLSLVLFKSIGMWLLLLGSVKVFMTVNRHANKSLGLEKILDGIPFYGEVRKHGALARFAKVVEIGLLAALGMPEIFRLAGLASQSARIRHDAEVVVTSTAQGESLTDSLAKTDAFPRMFRESIAVAEVSGTLDTGMRRLALIEHEAFIEAHERAAKGLPLLLYAIAACYVVFQILWQYQAPFSLYQEYL